MYNTLLYVGIAFLKSGFVLFIVSEMMIAHYDRKLWELKERNKWKQKEDK